MNVNIGVSDAKVSTSIDDVLVTHALGSCIAVAMFDPLMCIGGMLHFQLPSSLADPQRAAERPLMYGDSGMGWLLDRMERLGADKRRLKVWLAGGAKMLNDRGLFDIGRRNHVAIRKLLWDQRMFITAEQIGGIRPRTMLLHMADGVAAIRSGVETIAM